ncbi:MAG: TetR/AcrR family transcriptional regulator [Alphaproteobacteria bacterium]
MPSQAGERRGNQRQGWKQNPDAVKRDILKVAIAEFSANGLSGARVDDIAAKTRTSKRMIYYYFGDKVGLYSRALEAAYATVRTGEDALELMHLPPLEALSRLVAFTFDHHRRHPDFIRMVMIENIHDAEFLGRSDVIRELNVTAIENLAEICRRGEAEGSFRPGLDPVRLHWQISALSFFNVSNRLTFSALFGNALFEEGAQESLRDDVVNMVVSSVLPGDGNR